MRTKARQIQRPRLDEDVVPFTEYRREFAEGKGIPNGEVFDRIRGYFAIASYNFSAFNLCAKTHKLKAPIAIQPPI